MSDTAPLAAHHLPEHHLEDPAVLVVLDLRGRIDPNRRHEPRLGAIGCRGDDLGLLSRRGTAREARDVERLVSREPERRGRLARAELQRQDAQPNEVAAVDPLEALGDDRADAEESWSLRRPVPRRTAAVLLAGEHDERNALVAIAECGVVDRHPVAAREVRRPRTLGVGRELVAKTYVGERPPHHHLVVAATRAVAVELALLDAVVDEVPARG